MSQKSGYQEDARLAIDLTQLLCTILWKILLIQCLSVVVKTFGKIQITPPKYPKSTLVSNQTPPVCFNLIVFNWVCWGYQYSLKYSEHWRFVGRMLIVKTIGAHIDTYYSYKQLSCTIFSSISIKINSNASTTSKQLPQIEIELILISLIYYKALCWSVFPI